MTSADAIRLAREGYVQPISFQPHLPDALVHIMDRALQCDPSERYPNAGALAFELRGVALSLGVGDGRVFLRRALDREWGSDAEVTNELPYAPAPLPAHAQPRDFHDLDSLPTIANLDDAMLGGAADNDDDIVDGDLLDAY